MNVTHIEVPAPNSVLTIFRVIDGKTEINETVTIEHEFNPRKVIVKSELPINGFIEIM